MKKSLSLILLFVLSLQIVNAGETYALDFTISPSYKVGLKEGDRVEFQIKNSLNTVLVKKIALDGADIAIFNSIEEDNTEKVPLYTKITKQKYARFDAEKDGETDLNIIFQDSNSTAASILFQLPVGPNKNLEVSPKSQFQKDNFLKNLLYLLVILIVIFLLIYFILRRKAEETVEAVQSPDKKTEDKTE